MGKAEFALRNPWRCLDFQQGLTDILTLRTLFSRTEIRFSHGWTCLFDRLVSSGDGVFGCGLAEGPSIALRHWKGVRVSDTNRMILRAGGDLILVERAAVDAVCMAIKIDGNEAPRQSAALHGPADLVHFLPILGVCANNRCA